METRKTLTVIIPTYNMEKYLRKCLDSLIVSDENMWLLEVLVINDGSKDSSSAIAHEYELKHPHTFRVIDKENGNYGSCINRGLTEATGKYVKILDADDYSNISNLDKYISFLEKTDADLIISDFNIVDAEGNISGKRSFTNYFNQDKQVMAFTSLLAQHKDVAFQMHAITYRLDILHKIKYKQTEGISYTDIEWATIPIPHVKTVCYFPFSIYNYLIGREGQTMANYVEVTNHKQLFKIVENLSHFYQNQSYELDYNPYVKTKLKKAMSGIYEAGLKNNSISIDELKSYDEQLKKYPKAYVLANELKLSHNHISYVKHWRSGCLVRQFTFVKLPVILRNLVKK